MRILRGLGLAVGATLYLASCTAVGLAGGGVLLLFVLGLAR